MPAPPSPPPAPARSGARPARASTARFDMGYARPAGAHFESSDARPAGAHFESSDARPAGAPFEVWRARTPIVRFGVRAVIAVLLISACGEEARAAPPPLPEAPAAPSAPERDRASSTGAAPRPANTAPASTKPTPARANEATGTSGTTGARATSAKPARGSAVRENTSGTPAARGTAGGAPVRATAREPAPKKAKSKTTGAAYVPPPEPAPAPTPTAVRGPSAVVTPVASAPVAAKPKARVSIPRTEHVHAEIPSGLQADLDADPRMQPWVEKVIAIADACHAQARGNTGTIEAQLTMHEDERPNADVRSLPAQLGGLVACATGSLMRTKMPLFTGREGTRYTVRIVFE